MRNHLLLLLPCSLVAGSLILGAQPNGVEQKDFPSSEFKDRRAKVFDQIGTDALALIPGAPAAEGFQVFRQSNEFYYLCGIAAPHSYLLLDGRTRTATVYLPHRDQGAQRGGRGGGCGGAGAAPSVSSDTAAGARAVRSL